MRSWTPFENDVFLSLQKGLAGEVTPALRAVQVLVGDCNVHCRAYYDGEPSEKEREAMSYVETQLYADLPDDCAISFEVIQLDLPERLPQDWPSAYRRME